MSGVISVSVKFEDNSVQIKEEFKDRILAFLEEVGGEVQAKAMRNSRRDTGQTAGSFSHKVDESDQLVAIGSDYENAIWEEFGTGEYALHGDGRKGGWAYYKDGKRYFTFGKKPNRALQRAIDESKGQIISAAKERIGASF